MAEPYARWQQATLEQALTTRRVVLLSGPRQCGKTTLARSLASAQLPYLTLDDLTLAEAARNDPQGFVAHSGKTLIIDEVQRVPTLLSAIKRAVDEETRPGQYLLTGSANIQSLPQVQESLAGRIANIRLRPLSQGELQRKLPNFLEQAFSQNFTEKYVAHNKDAIIEMAVQGGFPEAIQLKGLARRNWHRDFISALVERDLKDIANIQRKDAMRELINIVAAWSSKFMDLTSMGKGLSIQRATLESYLNALETLYLVERIRPWAKTDYGRVGKQTKLFMTDCGLMAALLGWNIEQVRLHPDRCGKLIETFIFNELATQIDVGNGLYQLFHYRDREQREIDFLVEREDGALLGIEVKAGSAVGKEDFKHLLWFQKQLPPAEKFVAVVLYSGEHLVSFGPGLWAVPFGLLWG